MKKITLQSLKQLYAPFLVQYTLSPQETQQFLKALAYETYYGTLPPQKKETEFLLLQILAETISLSSLQKLLKQLPLSKQLPLIHYLFAQYREGSFFILQAFENLQSVSLTYKNLQRIILSLQRKFYRLEDLETFLLKHQPNKAKQLNELITYLERQSLSHVKKAYASFNQLIPLIVESPVKIFEAFQSQKKNDKPSSFSFPFEPEQIKQQQDYLRRQFQSFYTHDFSLKEFEAFLRLFGIQGHLFYLEFQGKWINEQTLLGKFQILHEIFSNVDLLTHTEGRELRNFFSFIRSLLFHLEMVHRDSTNVAIGLESLSWGIPTCGKELSRQASLPSIARSLKTVISTLNRNRRLKKKLVLKHCPVFIFDQSEDLLFQTNQRFLKKINQDQGCSFVSVSRKEIVELAKKIGVEPLLNTTKTGILGYGGARNCVFLLTPVLRRAFAHGKTSVQQVLQMKSSELQSLFEQHVLSGKSAVSGPGDLIVMSDDDVEMAETNLFSYLLFGKESEKDYAFSRGYVLGRMTLGIEFPTLDSVLKGTAGEELFPSMNSLPVAGAMNVYISRPQICLNAPFGGEEAFMGHMADSYPFLQPCFHLSGTRFPAMGEGFPTRHFVGLQFMLRGYLPYVLQVSMVNSLLDSANHRGHTVFPWNDRDWPKSENGKFLMDAACLRDVLQMMGRDDVKKEMQKRFWRNLEDLLGKLVKKKQAEKKEREKKKGEKKEGEEKSKRDWLLDNLRKLFEMDVDLCLREFLNQGKWSYLEKKSLKKICEIYVGLQMDAKLFVQLGKLAVERVHGKERGEWPLIVGEVVKRFEEECGVKVKEMGQGAYPLTWGLHRLIQLVGLGEFSEAVHVLSE